MPWVTSRHHILSIKHLLCQLWHRQRSVLLAATSCQGGKPGHEKVKPGEGDHVHCQLPQVSVQLAREPEAGGHTGHGERDQVVQVTIGGGGQLQGSKCDE